MAISNRSLASFSAFAIRTKGKRRRYRFVAWCLLLIGYFIFLISPLPDQIRGFIWFVAVQVYIVLYRKSKRYDLSSEKVFADERAPILFLRSFSDDQVDNCARVDRQTAEEILVSMLKDMGPVVAVGRPGEKNPPLGALRLYFKDDQWQEKVMSLMSIAQLVVIQAGSSDGLIWELEAVRKVAKPENVLVSLAHWQELPPRSFESKYFVFCKHMKGLLANQLPINAYHVLYIRFDDRWTPVLHSISWYRKLRRKLKLLRRKMRLTTLGFYSLRGMVLSSDIQSALPYRIKRGIRNNLIMRSLRWSNDHLLFTLYLSTTALFFLFLSIILYLLEWAA